MQPAFLSRHNSEQQFWQRAELPGGDRHRRAATMGRVQGAPDDAAPAQLLLLLLERQNYFRQFGVLPSLG